jgi:D-serine deaminase-like pyridoxal phosphate-dependent protein
MIGTISRRKVIGGSVVAAAALAVWNRPSDQSGERSDYFIGLQAALVRAGIAVPTLIIDRNRLDANIAQLKRDLPAGMAYRVVAKSLPSLDLLDHIRKGTGTNRLMVFNQPMLQALANAMPDADLLLGKPLPVRAAQALFDAGLSDAALERIHWLIDSPDRLAQYRQLAQTRNKPLKLALEIDVGLHRGGMVAGEAFGQVLTAIKADPKLQFSAMMGYEPHVPKVPELFGQRRRALGHAWDTYTQAQDQVREMLGEAELSAAIRNAAGSPTYRLYKDTRVANEVSVGSTLVKPVEFDSELLKVHQPAAFIATPVIKGPLDSSLPFGFGLVGKLQSLWDPNSRKTVFIYGGHWLALPEDPPGLQYNSLAGRSSNQELLNAGEQLAIKSDEFVFLRPTQAESVLTQFGEIAVFDGHEITQRWPVFPSTP